MKQISAAMVALVVATPAHAGISDMINDYFTFREEQKPLVAPQRQLPPKHVITPSYNGYEAQKWNNYYTRKDLKATQNFDSSSMVMRPRDPSDMAGYQAHLERLNREGVSPYQRAVEQQQNGQPLHKRYEELDYANRLAEQVDNRIYIGEPGVTPHAPYPATGVGAQTQVGEPKLSWKSKLNGNGYATPRVGDYDYGKQDSFGAQPWQEARLNELQRSQSTTMSDGTYTAPHTGNSAPSVAHNGANPSAVGAPSGMGDISAPMGYQQSLADKPTNYIVEQDDSLSGISGKERIYGDWKMWPLIYDANRNQIEDPDLIHPGQNLGIPRDYSGRDAQDARQRASEKHSPYNYYDGR